MSDDIQNEPNRTPMSMALDAWLDANGVHKSQARWTLHIAVSAALAAADQWRPMPSERPVVDKLRDRMEALEAAMRAAIEKVWEEPDAACHILDRALGANHE